MSFSKAKLKRFNDINIQTTVAAAGSKQVFKVEQFKIKKHSDSDFSSDTKSNKSTPCFRTPTLICKKKLPVLQSKLQIISKENVELEALKDKIVECKNKDASLCDLQNQLEEVKEKYCLLESNKAQLISEKAAYEQAISLQNLEHSKLMQKLMEDFEETSLEVQTKKELLQNEVALLRLKDDCNKVQSSCENLVKQHKEELHTKTVELNLKQQELRVLEIKCRDLQVNHDLEIQRIKEAHQIQIQDIEFEFLKTMTELQNEKEKVSHKTKEIEANTKREIEKMQHILNIEKLAIITGADQKIKEVEGKLSQEFEKQLKQKTLEIDQIYQTQLKQERSESQAILKECQTISEYNIIQCEIEKNKIKNELETRNTLFKNLQKTYEETLQSFDVTNKKLRNLENDLSRIILKLNQTKIKLKEELSQKKQDIEDISKERTIYQVSNKAYQTTIEVLKKRLIHSDQDVEQLKEELSKVEEKNLEYENKCLQYSIDLKQSQLLHEELESTIQLHRLEIGELKNSLFQKVYTQEVEKYLKKIVKDENDKEDILKQLHEAFAMIQRMKEKLEEHEVQNTEYEFELQRERNELEGYHLREMDWNNKTEAYEESMKQIENQLRTKNAELQDLYLEISHLRNANDLNKMILGGKSGLNEEEKTIYAKYIKVSGKYDDIQHKYEDLLKEKEQQDKKIMELLVNQQKYEIIKEKCIEQEKTIAELCIKVERLQNSKKLENDLLNRSKLNAVEEERDHLATKVEHLESELKEISQKWADLAGHHNNKQKIKHLSDLKQKNEELSQQNVDLSLKLQTQSKTLEKLKKENNELKKHVKKQKYISEDKENIGSPTRSLNSSRVESPFRERN